MTRRENREQNVWRRLEHARWERESSCGTVCWFVVAMFVGLFIVPYIMGAAS